MVALYRSVGDYLPVRNVKLLIWISEKIWHTYPNQFILVQCKQMCFFLKVKLNLFFIFQLFFSFYITVQIRQIFRINWYRVYSTYKFIGLAFQRSILSGVLVIQKRQHTDFLVVEPGWKTFKSYPYQKLSLPRDSQKKTNPQF